MANISNKPSYKDILEFSDTLEGLGFVPDRSRTTFVKRGAYGSVSIYLKRTTKGEFKHLEGRVTLLFVEWSAQGVPRQVSFKPCKALSVGYVKECMERGKEINTIVNDAFSAIAGKASLVDPKAILKKEGVA